MTEQMILLVEKETQHSPIALVDVQTMCDVAATGRPLRFSLDTEMIYYDTEDWNGYSGVRHYLKLSELKSSHLSGAENLMAQIAAAKMMV